MKDQGRVSSAARSELLVNVAVLRSGVFDATTAPSMEARISRFCDSLAAWGNMPSAARRVYGRALIDCLFELAADIEDDSELEDVERMAVELSLWQAVGEMRLPEIDRSRSDFISRHQLRMEQSLEVGAKKGAERLLHKWAALLRPRAERIRQLPGPFREDISAVVAELADAGLPRRAKVLAGKFQLALDPLVRWMIEHRPESEETGRTRQLLERVANPLGLVPYRVLVCSRALRTVLSAPIGAIPMAVGASGSITIDGRAYGVGGS